MEELPARNPDYALVYHPTVVEQPALEHTSITHPSMGDGDILTIDTDLVTHPTMSENRTASMVDTGPVTHLTVSDPNPVSTTDIESTTHLPVSYCDIVHAVRANPDTHPTVSEVGEALATLLPSTCPTPSTEPVATGTCTADPGVPKTPPVCRTGKIRHYQALRKNIRKVLTEISQLKCQYQNTLVSLEKASHHSDLIRELVTPPPISRAELVKIEALVEQAYSACLPPLLSTSCQDTQVELMKKILELTLVIRGLFKKLDPIWACADCPHIRLNEVKMLGESPSPPARSRGRFSFNQDFQRDMTMLRERFDRELLLEEIEPLRDRTTTILIRATEQLFRFHRSKLLQEQVALLDPELGRRTRYPTYLVSDYDLWQIKPLLKRGLELCTIDLDKITNLIRFRKVLYEANQTALIIGHLFDEVSNSQGRIDTYGVARTIVTLLKHAEDPSYLLIPDMDDIIDLSEAISKL
jgi:hypothetical protein